MTQKFPPPCPGMTVEIRRYKSIGKSRENPQFPWLLRCTRCRSYRDRDELYEAPYDDECLVCINKSGREWVSPTPEPVPEPAASPSSARSVVYKAPVVTPEQREAIKRRNAAVLAALAEPPLVQRPSGMDAVMAFMAAQKHPPSRN